MYQYIIAQWTWSMGVRKIEFWRASPPHALTCPACRALNARNRP